MNNKCERVERRNVSMYPHQWQVVDEKALAVGKPGDTSAGLKALVAEYCRLFSGLSALDVAVLNQVAKDEGLDGLGEAVGFLIRSWARHDSTQFSGVHSGRLRHCVSKRTITAGIPGVTSAGIYRSVHDCGDQLVPPGSVISDRGVLRAGSGGFLCGLYIIASQAAGGSDGCVLFLCADDGIV